MIDFHRDFDFTYGVAEQVAHGVRRIVANNPKDYTWTGTNTHLVGERDVAIVDAGPALDTHADAVMAAVGDRPVRAILVTHPHKDHSAGAALLQSRTGAPVFGRTRLTAEIAARTDEDVDLDFTPDHDLADGMIIEGSDWALETLHTPGHFPDHLCFALKGRDVLFTGDHVMGWSTTVISPPLGHLGDYLGSLERLHARPESRFLPSHGPAIEEPGTFVSSLIAHRHERTRQIRQCLDQGLTDAEAIVEAIYSGLSPRLIKAAAQSVRAHLDYIRETRSATAAE